MASSQLNMFGGASAILNASIVMSGTRERRPFLKKRNQENLLSIRSNIVSCNSIG